MEKPKILVVGSMNMDLFVEGANSIPKYGESIICAGYGYATGGKGSNQAVAASRQGGDVVAVGRLSEWRTAFKIPSECQCKHRLYRNGRGGSDRSGSDAFR